MTRWRLPPRSRGMQIHMTQWSWLDNECGRHESQCWTAVQTGMGSSNSTVTPVGLCQLVLDQERLNTILPPSGAAPLAEALRSERGLAFSFTRRDADPERARRDLVLVIDTLAAQPRLYAALEAATARLKENGDEA